MNDKSFRPAVANKLEDTENIKILILAFPIWWYVAPTIINTFLEQYVWNDKIIIPVATSGSSGMGNTNAELESSCPGAILKDGKRFDAVSYTHLDVYKRQVVCMSHRRLKIR